MTKTCNECKQEKPVTEFFRDKAFKDGYYSRCKTCKTTSVLEYRAKKKDKYNQYMKKYRAEHPDCEANKARDRRKSLRLRYGLLDGDYERILASQNGMCAICPAKAAESKRAFHVDHCHKTGKVRGILCPGCNIGIAILDAPEKRVRAQEYIDKAKVA